MEDNQKIELDLYEEFKLKSFEYQIQPINLEQSKELLVDLYRQLLLKEAYCKQLLKEKILTSSNFAFE